MVQAYSGAVTQWCRHTVVQSHSGTGIEWCSHTMVQACNSAGMQGDEHTVVQALYSLCLVHPVPATTCACYMCLLQHGTILHLRKFLSVIYDYLFLFRYVFKPLLLLATYSYNVMGSIMEHVWGI